MTLADPVRRLVATSTAPRRVEVLPTGPDALPVGHVRSAPPTRSSRDLPDERVAAQRCDGIELRGRSAHRVRDRLPEPAGRSGQAVERAEQATGAASATPPPAVARA